MGAGVAVGQLRPRLWSGGGAACSRERPAGYRQVHDVREQVAAFREVGLLDERSAAIERFGRRARDDDDPYIQYTHHHVGSRGGAARLGAMYDALLDLLRLVPDATVVRSTAGAAEETYALLTDALHGPGG